MIIPEVSPRSLSNQTILQKTASKIGSYLPNKLCKTFEMTNKGGFDRYPLFLIAIVFVLGARFVKSRDAHERREVLTRDGITVSSTFFALPVIKNWISRGLDKITKIPTASDKTKFFSLADFSMDNLKNLYSKADKMPEQALTMAKNIVKEGGNISKAFSKLGEEGIKALETIAGKDLSNSNVLKTLEQAMNSSGDKKEAFNMLTKLLSPADNALVQAAQRLKAIPNLVSIVLTTLFLGWGIPAFNIYFTRNKLKHNKDTKSQPENTLKLEPTLSESQKQIIESFFAKA